MSRDPEKEETVPYFFLKTRGDSHENRRIYLHRRWFQWLKTTNVKPVVWPSRLGKDWKNIRIRTWRNRVVVDVSHQFWKREERRL